MKPEDCPHMSFRALVAVNRLEDAGRFVAEIQVVCEVCGIPFKFLGMPAGVMAGKPTTSFAGEEARLPIAPMTDPEDAKFVEALTTANPGTPTKH